MSGYRPELDVVRFLAFILVFFHHVLPRSPWDWTPLNQAYIKAEPLFYAVANACGMGMCLFFCLSAYLITEILLKERSIRGAISIKKFYIRRALRIWPLYFFGIALGIGMALMMHLGSVVTAFLWYLLFAGNFYCGLFGWPISPFTPLWSISLEEQFYLIWPWAMRSFSRRGLILSAFFFILVANITLLYFGARHTDNEFVVWTNTFVQFEMFATGILLAFVKRDSTRNHAAIGYVLVATGPILWFIASYFFHIIDMVSRIATSGVVLVAGYALVALGCAAVLHGFCLIGPSSMPIWAAKLGKISYGLYVFHLFAILIARAIFAPYHAFSYRIIESLFALLLTILAAKISYVCLESPFLRLKRRFEVLHTRPI